MFEISDKNKYKITEKKIKMKIYIEKCHEM